MHYSICQYCKQPKAFHSQDELREHSRLMKEMTKDIIPEPKPKAMVYPDPLSDRAARRMR